MEEGGESSCTSSHLPPSARRFGHAATPTNAHGHAHADFLSTVMDEHAAAAGGQRWEPHFTVNTANDILDNNNKENMQALPRNAPKQDDAHLLAMLHQDPALMLQIQQSQANAVMVQTAQTTNQTPSASALGVQMNDLRQWYPKLPAGMVCVVVG